MSSLDDAATALNQIQTDDIDVQTQVTNALAAITAAQAAGGTVDTNDALVTSIIAVFTGAGYTVTPPASPVAPEPELPAGPTDGAVADSTPSASVTVG